MKQRGRVTGAGPVIRCDAASLPDIAATWITGAIDAVTRLQGRCTIALAGGATPRPIYERMATAPLAGRVAWDRVAVYFGDERRVPPAHPDSNYRMAYESLLRHVAIPSASVHRIEGERADADAAARDYERLLPASLDVLLLGMGADGHTASLFPHSSALAEGTRRVLPVSRPAPSPGRITISPLVIELAHSILVVVAGAEKAAAVARAREGPYAPDALPVQLALRGTWLIDDDAARDLRGIEA